ncbi:MAG: helix-turn-helix domain-containing protein [Proteobacteria bacterium]|nr:helix-turn-helix domain-containing protein [Pseudomonadota bacterium]
MFDAKSALHDIAHQIHICRTDERLTLQLLAQRSGVAASTIHKIEAQQMVPTISVLFKIARGLGRRPAELIRDQHEYRTTETSSRSTLSYEFEETEPKSNVGVWHIELAAHESLPALELDPLQHAILLVERGAVDVVAGERRVLMGSGDCIAVDGGRIHSHDNQEDAARLTLIVSPPGDLDRFLGAPTPSTPVYQPIFS